MKTRSLFAALSMFVGFNSFSFAQDEDMMKAWQEFMTPGPMHKMMSGMVGEWNTEMKMWMDPSQPPTESKGKMKYEAIMDGRYFLGKFEGEYTGMPFHGMEISGYDNAKKMFFSTWIDNFGTGIMMLEGKMDEATHTITYRGTTTDPMGKEMRVKEIIKNIDDDHSFMEMYMEQDGKEMKTMEMHAIRVK